jgi:hypothetical protein
MTALVLASFDRIAPFRDAIVRVRDAGRAIVGLWTPMPVEIPDAPTDGGRGIAWLMAITGVGGAMLLYLLIWWSAVIAYPFDSGSRPLHSWPTFLIAPVEVGALVAAIGGTIAFFTRARLTRLHDAAFEIDEVATAACDRFVIALRCDAGADANRLIAMLADAGAIHSRLLDE